MPRVLGAMLLVGLVFLLSGCAGRTPTVESGDLSGVITVSGAWALYPLMVRWSEVFSEIHPAVRFDISAGGAGKGMADALGQLADIGMVSREIYPEELARGAFALPVAKDAVFPTVSAENPALPQLLAHGIPRDVFVALWVHGEPMTWGQLVDDPSIDRPVNVFTRSDACGAGQTWAQYLGVDQEDLQGVALFGDPGLAEALSREPLGLGYNNLNYAFNPTTGELSPGIVVVPIDTDGDGLISEGEGPYTHLRQAASAIASGAYPSPPARALYLVTRGAPSGIVREFLSWVLSDGQRLVEEAAYVPLPADWIVRALERLGETPES